MIMLHITSHQWIEHIIQIDENCILIMRTLTIKNHIFGLKTSKTTHESQSSAIGSILFFPRAKITFRFQIQLTPLQCHYNQDCKLTPKSKSGATGSTIFWG